MRKIISKEQASKKQKRNQLILAGMLILIMFGSVFGIIVNSFGNNAKNNERVEYNGYTFLNQNGFWITEIGDYTFMFKYNPEQVEKISSKLNYSDKYSGKPLYILSEDYISDVEIYRNLGQIVQRFQGACLNETGCRENYPVKDCSNNFIIIRQANESRITQKGDCVFIEGNYENLTSLTDEFLFKIFNIEK